MRFPRQEVSAETLRVSTTTSEYYEPDSRGRRTARQTRGRSGRPRPHRRGRGRGERGAATTTSAANRASTPVRPALAAGKAAVSRVIGRFGHTLRAALLLLLHLLAATVFRPFVYLYCWLYEFPDEVQFRRTTQRFLGVLSSTESFRTFLPAARQLDTHLGIDAWRLQAPPRSVCNAAGLVFDAQVARELAGSGNELAMGFFLRAMLLRSAHGMTDPRLYPYLTGTKACVEDYGSAVCLLISVFAGSRSPTDAARLTVRPCFQRRPAQAMNFSEPVSISSSAPSTARERLHNRQRDLRLDTIDLTELTAEAIRQHTAGRESTHNVHVARSTSVGDRAVGAADTEQLLITSCLSARGGDCTVSEPLLQLDCSQDTTGSGSEDSMEGGDTTAPTLSAPSTSELPLPAVGPAVDRALQRWSSGATVPGLAAGDGFAFTASILAWAEAHGTQRGPDPFAAAPSRAQGGDRVVAPLRGCLTPRQRLDILREVLQSFGRTALILSGGASMGAYHTGVVRGLFEAAVLPEIMSGSSAGSIIAALLCTKPPSELKRLIEVDVLSTDALQLTPFGQDTGLAQKVRRFLKTGFLMDVRSLMECMRTHCGDLTFLEAYRLSGRVLNICVTRDQQKGTHFDRHVLLNFRTAPNVVVWSAVSASCALPGLFTAVQLIEKSPETGFFQPYLPGELYCDGSVAQDVPRDRLAQLFNVNYCIVSQVNPYVIPFLHPARPGAVDASAGAVLPQDLTFGSRVSVMGRLWYGAAALTRHFLLRCFDSGILPKRGALEVPYMLLTQCYSGDVTILPIGDITSAAPDYLNMVNNPSAQYISYVASRGQVRTWPFVARIRNASRIERTLAKEIAALEKALEQNERGAL